MIDTKFNMYSDANGGDPDSTSPTLRQYHQTLWSKPLPDGTVFELQKTKGFYLYHNSSLGEFSLGSDAITHSYKHQVRKRWLTEQIPDHVQDVFDAGSTIGGYLLFPKNLEGRKQTINQARGILRLIDDRFDLTLECIRRFYINDPSPLMEVFLRYESFFRLFQTFDRYVDFFLLNDLVTENGEIRFYLPFDNFQTPPTFHCTDDYIQYKRRVLDFVENRSRRMVESITKT